MIDIKKILTKKNIIIFVVILFLYFWGTKIIGFYMNLLNPLRPSIGNFWKVYNERLIVDSTKNELFEIEKLKLVARKKIDDDIKNLAVYLDSLQEITLERKEFLDLSHRILSSLNNHDSILVKFLPFYFTTKWNKVILRKKNSFLIFYFIDARKKALPDNLIIDYDILSYNIMQEENNNVVDTIYWYMVSRPLPKNLREIDPFDLFKFCSEEYKKNSIVPIKGLYFLFKQLDKIDNFYFEDKNATLYVVFDDFLCYAQSFDMRTLSDFQEFLKLKEFGYK